MQTFAVFAPATGETSGGNGPKGGSASGGSRSPYAQGHVQGRSGHHRQDPAPGHSRIRQNHHHQTDANTAHQRVYRRVSF